MEVTDDGRHGKVIALKDIKSGYDKVKNLPESISIGCTSYYDGAANTAIFINKLRELRTRYGGRQKLAEEIYNAGNGWYIPSYGELFKLYSDLFNSASDENFKMFNKLLSSYNADKINKYYPYISSTEAKVRNAPVYYFGEVMFEKSTLGMTDSMEGMYDNRGKREGRIRLFHKF